MTLRLPIGEHPPRPPSGALDLFADDNGVVSKIDPSGVKTELGGLALPYITTLGVASTTLAVAGLNGAVDGDYIIDGEITFAQPNVGLDFRPNGLTSNLRAFAGDNLVGPVSNTSWAVARSATNPFLWATTMAINITNGRLRVRTGATRTIRLEMKARGGAAAFNGSNADDIFYLSGEWSDTATNLTSLELVSSVASGLAIGSWLRLTPTGIKA